MTQNNTENILGYQITTRNTRESIEQITTWLDAGELRKIFVCANPHSLVEARHNPQFQQALHGANLVTPDGTGIVLASKLGWLHPPTGNRKRYLLGTQ